MSKTSHDDVVGQHRLELTHGNQVPRHRHGRGHLVYPAAGVLSVTTDLGTWIAPATRLVWTPAGADHEHRAYGKTDMRIVFLAGGLAARLPAHPAVFSVSPLAREALLALSGTTGPARSPAAAERLSAVIVDELALAPEQPLHLPRPRDDRLRALTDRLRRNPADTTPLDGLGAKVGASKRTLSRLFQDELGMSFVQWRSQLRLHHALTLLAAGETVTHTSIACGWSNPSTFIHAFTKALGQTPGRYAARDR